MKILKNDYLISADPEANSKKVIKDANGNDITIYVDTSWDKIKHAVKFGTIFKCPIGFDENYSGGKLNEGDNVVFHQFVVQPENIINYDGKDYYRAHYMHVWAKIDGDDIYPVDKWLFVEPIVDEDNITDDGLVKNVFAKYLPNVGIVKASSDYVKTFGIKDGDKIHFMNDADYPIEINGKLYYRMRIDSVICIERNSFAVPLSNKLIVIEEEKKDKGIIELLNKNPDENYGEVIFVGDDIDEINVGARIRFGHGLGTKVTIDDIDYRCIEMRHVIYEIVPKHSKNILGIRVFA